MVALGGLWVRTYQLVPVRGSDQRSGRIYSREKIADTDDNVIVPVPMMSEEGSDKRGVREIMEKEKD